MDKNIRLRQAGIDELDLILEWRMRVIQTVFEKTEKEAYKLYSANKEYYEKNLPTGNHITCFACLDDEIIGCGGMCFYEELPSPDNPSGRVGLFMNALTLPKYRRQGVMHAILTRLIEQAFEKGVYKITLETTDLARSLYESMGFIDYKDVMIFINKKED